MKKKPKTFCGQLKEKKGGGGNFQPSPIAIFHPPWLLCISLGAHRLESPGRVLRLVWCQQPTLSAASFYKLAKEKFTCFPDFSSAD